MNWRNANIFEIEKVERLYPCIFKHHMKPLIDQGEIPKITVNETHFKVANKTLVLDKKE